MGAVTPIKRSTPVVAEWLSPQQVCERVPGMTVERLSKLRDQRSGPSFYKPTLKTVVYEAGEIDAWVARTRVSTGGASS